jgi:6-phosphogluconolactonase (cycloisomerase 2 family)
MLKSSVAVLVGLAFVASTPTAASANGSRDVYVSDYLADSVSVFKTGAGGELLGGPATTTVNEAQAMVFSPDGRSFYAADYVTGDIDAFSVASDGSLTPMPGASVSDGASAFGITVTPDGKYLFATENGTDTVVGYAIGPTGALSGYPGNLTAVSGAVDIYGIVASPDSASLYLTDAGTNDVRAFTIGAAGALTEKAGSPIPAGDPYSAQITPDGTRLYVGNYASNNISGYRIAADGTLSALAGSPYSGISGPYAGMAVSPDGSRLYATSYDADNVVSFAIAADGSLATVGAPVAAGSETNGLVVSPSGRYVYASAGSSHQVFAFAVQPDGSLAANGSPQALDPTGYSEFQSVAMRPNQPPTARLSTKTVNGVTTLDASASTDSDGSVVSYAWTFGDGTTTTTTTPTVQHTYADGTRQATVKVTDDEGCSTTRIATGLSVLCNGSAVSAATTTQVAGIAGVQVSAKKSQKQRGALKVVIKARASEAVGISVTGFAKVKGVKGKVVLKPVVVNSTASSVATVKLKAKKKEQGTAVVGHKGHVMLTVTLTDADGYVVTQTVRVKVS